VFIGHPLLTIVVLGHGQAADARMGICEKRHRMSASFEERTFASESAISGQCAENWPLLRFLGGYFGERTSQAQFFGAPFGQQIDLDEEISINNNTLEQFLAERQGFEPWRRLPAYTRSRRAPSTTRPPLRLYSRVSGSGRREAHASLHGQHLHEQMPEGAFDHSATSPSVLPRQRKWSKRSARLSSWVAFA
jgi:hypothetical protein